MSIKNPVPLDAGAERYALAHAYVPEQIPSLMTAISHAEPFLIEDYLFFTKDDWVIFIGYPYREEFSAAHCGELVANVLEMRRPGCLWFIGPEIPPVIGNSCRVRMSDQYFRLDLSNAAVKSSLKREVKQAARTLAVERSRKFTGEHKTLVKELMSRKDMQPMVAELYKSMPDYIRDCESAHMLNARDEKGKLCAFFVDELGAEKFDAYILGGHSKKNYIPHASDLLFAEMIAFAEERGKQSINLGLGVNEGIQRFKEKWGGCPYRAYEFCECYFGPPAAISILDKLLR